MTPVSATTKAGSGVLEAIQSPGDALEFRVLGPLEVMAKGGTLSFGGRREGALLARLLLSANRVVSCERLVDDLWASDPPENAFGALQVYVSRLRKALRGCGLDDVLVTRPPGYVLQVRPDAFDATCFESLVAQGREQSGLGDHRAAAETLRSALALWRGSALADVGDLPFARAEATRLEESRLAALEARIEADLVCGRHGELIGELAALVGEYPLRERLWSQRMLALYRAGRQAEALRCYQDLRRVLGEELGIEPSAPLRNLEGAILRHDPDLDWAGAGPVEGTVSVDVAADPSPQPTAGGVVTFMFTDLVGSTQLFEELGEDNAEGFRRRHFAVLRDVVADHRGTEVKNLGDGLMVAFESPLAALSCAVQIQQAVHASGGEQEWPVSVRVGLHAGEPQREDGDFFGTPVVVAKRLCDQAGGGQILTSALLRDLVGRRGGYRFRDLGGVSLKGLAEPLTTYEVVWSTAAENEIVDVGPLALKRPPEALPARETSGKLLPELSIPMPSFLRTPGGMFVGRELELEQLRHIYKEACAGEARVVFLAGEPGVGKTRLAAEMAREAHDEEAVVLAGRCDEDLGVPYQPFVEALRYFLNHTPDHDLGRRLGRYPGELTRLIPELAERLPGLAAPLRSDPETERYRLFDAINGWLSTICHDQPLVLVFDDLQWAAKPTLFLLRHVIRSTEQTQLLILATYRDTPLSGSHPLSELLADLRRTPGLQRVCLSGLDSSAVTALVQQATGHRIGEDNLALARAVHQETQGNPFFIGEILRDVAESGLPVEALPVPEGVREVIISRVARLGSATGEIVSAAAVLGPDCEFGPLVAVAEVQEKVAVDALDEALAARLVEETGVGTYRFVHALVRSALISTLSATRRAQLHLRAANVFEGKDDVASLAHHLLNSAPLADPARTATACLAAGDRALTVLADAEALDWYSQGLAFADHDPHLRIDLMIGLGESQRRMGDSGSCRTLLDAAHSAAGHGDAGRLVRAVLANSRGFASDIRHVDEERLEVINTALDLVGSAPSADRAELLALQATELLLAGDHEDRLRAADEAGTIAARLKDVTVGARVGVRRLLASLLPNRVAASIFEGSEIVSLADTSGDPQLRALSRTVWIAPLFLAGDLSEARRRTAEAMAIADDTVQPGLRSLAHFCHAGATDALGDHKDAKRLTEAALDLGQQAAFSDAPIIYVARMALHWVFEGQAETAVAVAAEAMAESEHLAWQAAWAFFISLCGQENKLVDFLSNLPSILPSIPVDFTWPATHFLFGIAQGFGFHNPEVAATIYEALLPYHSLHAAIGGIVYLGPIEVALGVLARVLGDMDGALAHHESAAEAIEACRAARARALNDYQWALALLAQDGPGDRQRAADMAEETLAYCHTKGYTTFVTKTKDLLTTIC